jgi:DNA mismatch endonuclease (patch repair protein)
MKKSPEERLRMMRAIKGRNTTPELAVRRSAHQMGYRFRLNRTDLPGTPDLVFVSRQKVIFVHGCFWHAHGCKLTRVPKANLEYWVSKFKRNRIRDEKNLEALAAQGWRYLVIWECEIRDSEKLQQRLKNFLE